MRAMVPIGRRWCYRGAVASGWHEEDPSGELSDEELAAAGLGSRQRHEITARFHKGALIVGLPVLGLGGIYLGIVAAVRIAMHFAGVDPAKAGGGALAGFELLGGVAWDAGVGLVAAFAGGSLGFTIGIVSAFLVSMWMAKR